MKKWLAVLMVVLSVAAHSASAQEPLRRGEFEPPVRMPAAPDTTVPSPTPSTTPSGLPPADDKPPLANPTPEPIPTPPTPDTPPPPETTAAPAATVPGTGLASAPCNNCAACQAQCHRSCCEKLAAWACHRREKTPDLCCHDDKRDAPLYTFFLDHPCSSASITAVGPPMSCACKKPCPFDGCIFGHWLGNGNPSCP